jgi:hypothetical protein
VSTYKSVMDTKDELVSSIKEWIQLDNTIKLLRAEVKSKLTLQKSINSRLLEMMKNNEIDTLNTSEVQISRVQKETKHPISKKYLENVLLEYYDNNSNKATEVQDYIMNHRTSSIKESIRTKRI